MTTPTGQIKLSDVRLEIYGSAAGSISMSDPNVYYLADKTSGSISMSDLKGKSYVRWNPDANGSYGTSSSYPVNAGYTITSNYPATWDYTRTTGSGTWSTVNIPTGSSSNTITFTVQAPSTGGDRLATWSVTSTSFGKTRTYTITLSASSNA
jgi:hypothetical protein